MASAPSYAAWEKCAELLDELEARSGADAIKTDNWSVLAAALLFCRVRRVQQRCRVLPHSRAAYSVVRATHTPHTLSPLPLGRLGLLPRVPGGVRRLRPPAPRHADAVPARAARGGQGGPAGVLPQARHMHSDGGGCLSRGACSWGGGVQSQLAVTVVFYLRREGQWGRWFYVKERHAAGM